MPSRRRRVILLAIAFFVVHLAATFYAGIRLGETLEADGPLAGRFGPSFALAIAVFPFYPILKGVLSFNVITLLNCVVCAVVSALALVYLRWRTIVAMMLAIAVLTLGGATLAAKLLEHQVEAGWRELALRPADPVLHGEALSSELGDLSIDPLNNYVARELAAGDDVVDPPPQEVDYFLVVHRGEIDALRQRLLTGPPPVL